MDRLNDMIRYSLLQMTFGCSLSVAAQQKNIVGELQATQPGQGVITIVQDAKIGALLGTVYVKDAESSEPQMLKARGYRVQVYAGNNSRKAREEANKVAEDIKKEFPELPVYSFFQPPRWLCRVGDYRSIEEADASMRSLKATGKFKEVSIVREQINIPIN